MKSGESMSREQYGALKRRVGGTGSGFFGESVALKGRYADRGWVEGQEEETQQRKAAASEAAPFNLPLFAVALAGAGAGVLVLLERR